MSTFIKIRDLRVTNFGPLVMELPPSQIHFKFIYHVDDQDLETFLSPARWTDKGGYIRLKLECFRICFISCTCVQCLSYGGQVPQGTTY